MTYVLPHAVPDGVPITISDAAGKKIRTLRGPAQAGLNRACWDLRESPPVAEANSEPISTCIKVEAARDQRKAPVIPPSGQMPQGGEEGGRGRRGVGPVVLPGHYTVAVNSLKQDVTVEPDPQSTLSDSDRQARHSAILSVYSLQQQLTPARSVARALADEMAGLKRFSRRPTRRLQSNRSIN